MLQLWAVILLFVPLTSQGHPTESADEQFLLILLFDGVRWDYIESDSLKGFPRMAKSGVKAEYVRPIYPSNSYPNWYAIATGLYAENHGIVDNFMYDPQHDDYFLMAPDSGVFKEHWWNDAEPVWVTAEKNGIKASLSNWVGCEVKIRGTYPTICERRRSPFVLWALDDKRTLHATLRMLDRFQRNETRLGMVYHEIVDASGHTFGPDSFVTKLAVKSIDTILDRVQDEVEKRGLLDKVNIVVVSDHGMTWKTWPKTRTISLDDVISPDDIKVMLDVNYNSMIWPMEGKEDVVYRKLVEAKKPGLYVYKKEDLPEQYHYKNHRLIAPIVLRTDKDYVIIPLKSKNKVKPYFPLGSISTYFQPGIHGFDPYSDAMTDMRTIFLATGPGFKKGIVASPLEMVDHYNVFCHLLGIQPLQNNGSWERVKGFLQNVS